MMVTAMMSLYKNVEIHLYQTMVSGSAIHFLAIMAGVYLSVSIICQSPQLMMFCSPVVMFFRFITSGEIKKRSEFYEPFIQGLTNTSVEQVCLHNILLTICPYIVCSHAFTEKLV